MKEQRDLPALVLVVAVALAAFAGTAGHALLWDDPILLGYSEKLVREHGFPGLLSAEFQLDVEGRAPLGYYRPVVLVSLWVDRLLSSVVPQSYHLTNILLHGLNAGLVFRLLRSFVPVMASAFGALVFAVHPVHTESVAFVSGRTDLFAACFVLVSAILWIEARRREERGQATPPLLMAAVASSFMLGALAKETALFLPFVLLVWEGVAAAARGSSPLRYLARNRAWILAFAAAILVVLALRFLVAGVGLGTSGIGVKQFAASHSGILPSLFFQCLAAYARLLVVPWPLNAYYTLNQITVSLPTVAAIALLAALTAAPLPGRSAEPRLAYRSLAFLWMLVFILPVCRLFPFSGAVVAERFLYLPSIGYSLLLASWADRLAFAPRLAQHAIRGLCILLLAVMAAGTLSRARVWREPETFFRVLAASSPSSALGPYNLGNAHLARNEQEEAARAFREAARREPNHADAFFNLGLALSHLERWPEAREAYQRSLAVNPGRVDVLTNLAIATAAAGDLPAAVPLFRRAIETDPSYSRAWFNLGLVQEKLGDSPAAARSYGEATRLERRTTRAPYGTPP